MYCVHHPFGFHIISVISLAFIAFFRPLLSANVSTCGLNSARPLGSGVNSFLYIDYLCLRALFVCE